MPDANKAVNVVVVLTVIGLMTAFLLPVAIGAVANDETQTITQNTTETVTLQTNLNVTLDATDDTGDTGDYTVTLNGDSATATGVAAGSNTTVTVDGTDVTIAPQTINTGSATTEYSYPPQTGWGNGAGAMWVLIPVLMVLAAFLFIVGMALNRSPL